MRSAGRVLVRRTVGDRRRWLVGWSIGIVAFVVLNLAFYPSFRDQADQMNEMFANLPESVRSLIGLGGGLDPFSPVGYLSSQVFALSLPLLLLVAGIGLGAAMTGDEEHGLLETTFSAPVRRRQVLLGRSLGHLLLLAGLGVVALVTVVVSVRAVSLDVGLAALVWPTVALLALVVAACQLTLAVGAWTGRRPVAIATGSVVAVASYVITSLADARIAFFDHLRPVSLFTHYDVVDLLRTGRPTWSLLVLVGVAAVSTAVAVIGIERRDVRG